MLLFGTCFLVAGVVLIGAVIGLWIWCARKIHLNEESNWEDTL